MKLNREFQRARALLSMVRVNKSLLPQAILRWLNYIALLQHECFEGDESPPPSDSFDYSLKETTIFSLLQVVHPSAGTVVMYMYNNGLQIWDPSKPFPYCLNK